MKTIFTIATLLMIATGTTATAQQTTSFRDMQRQLQERLANDPLPQRREELRLRRETLRLDREEARLDREERAFRRSMTPMTQEEIERMREHARAVAASGIYYAPCGIDPVTRRPWTCGWVDGTPVRHPSAAAPAPAVDPQGASPRAHAGSETDCREREGRFYSIIACR